MNWITNFVRPKIRALVAKRDVPEDLWDRCPACDSMLFRKDLIANLRVCMQCGHHMRLTAKERLGQLFDGGTFETIELPKSPADPLRFRDSKRYTDRLREAQAKTGLQDACVVGHGTVGGQPAVIAAFDFGFMGGSMGIAVGEAIVTAARLAVAQQAAFIAIPASGGARMQEGILSLMQMPRTVVAVQHVRDAGLPYIVVFADPTTGGVSASFAMLGDIHIAEKGAQIGFAGARVIEETMRQSLPDGFQRAEFLHEHGMVDLVVTRKELKPTLDRVLGILMQHEKVVETQAEETILATASEPDSAEADDEVAAENPGSPPVTDAVPDEAAKPVDIADPDTGEVAGTVVDLTDDQPETLAEPDASEVASDDEDADTMRPAAQ